MNKTYPNIKTMILEAGRSLLGPRALIREPGKWQGLDIDHKMIEVFDTTFRVPIPESLDQLREQSKPDLPWADDHFDERTGGSPTNPGNTFKGWPYYKEDSYRKGGVFTHTYQERIWPKFAGEVPRSPNKMLGIRFEYGDLDDVIRLLSKNPNTRQAFLPIWFPEDTGVVHKGRVPCTIGYLFSYRDGYLHMTYYIRSCDYIRHFKNDIYLACRMLFFVLENLALLETPINWKKVKPGRLKMDVESLHIFDTDTYELKKRLK
jgi:hypothetical protein